MTIDYDHTKNPHHLAGPKAAISLIFAEERPNSIIDIGCGTGTWLKAALECGINDVSGLDGIVPSQIHIPRSMIQQIDFTRPFDIGRRFDIAICLEVAEHLAKEVASDFVSSIIRHSDRVLFSAAAPDQPGQHHVNCQWPEYWQALFNSHGYACDDTIRWRLWACDEIEPYYRQNMFWAIHQPTNAGKEPRLKRVIHPEMLDGMSLSRIQAAKKDIENGNECIEWYLTVGAKNVARKIARCDVLRVAWRGIHSALKDQSFQASPTVKQQEK